MPTFATHAEIFPLGAPVVRLFRTAFGRDPDPADLDRFVARLREGSDLRELARELAATEEFERLHGPGTASDEGFVARIQRHASATGADERTALLAIAGLGATRAELVAALAASPAGRRNIPLLPGLAPGVPPDDRAAYRLWVEAYDTPDPAALGRLAPPSGPRVSVALAAGDTDMEAALRTVESLRAQTYDHWEVLLVARLASSWPKQALAQLAEREARVRVLVPSASPSRAAAFAHALAARTGGLGCLLSPGDRLAPTALQEVVAEFAAHPDVQLLYTDEDVWDGDGRRAPRLKPAYSPDAGLAGNLLGQLTVYHSGLLDRVGGLRPEAAPREAYDLAHRAAALAWPGGVRHLPAVLCHRAAPPTDWPTPADTPPRASPGVDVLDGAPWPRVRARPPDPPPSVTVVVPTRDRADLLAACAAGVLERTPYPRLDLMVVDNGSTAPDALALLDRLGATPRVRVLRRPGPFNFAALNNAAAAEAGGDVLLLLNDDTEVLHPDWLHELAAHAVRPDVGAVGARLLYPGGTVQHAGILLGPDGAVTHVGRGARPDDPGYLGQLACTRDLSAVTGACLAIRREVWHRVGGMDERLAVTWNDVDLCLRVRAAGLRVVWTPHATLTHKEGASRGSEADDPAASARFRAEQELVRRTWGDAVEHDPFLNPNLLAAEAGPLVLTRPRRRRPWT